MPHSPPNGRPPVTSRHARCRDCGAWVDVRSEHCGLCGIAWPVSKWLRLRQEIGLQWRDLAAMVGATGGLFAGLGLWQFWQACVRYGLPWPLRLAFLAATTLMGYALGRALVSARVAFFFACGALALAMPVAVHGELLRTFPDGVAGTALTLGLGAVGWFLGRVLGPGIAARLWDARQPRSVLESRQALQTRLKTLRESAEKMRMLGLQLAQQLPGQQSHPALTTLRTAVTASEEQVRSGEIHLWLITTALWQNQAQPVLASWRHLTAAESERAVAALDKMTREGEQLADSWQRAPEAEDPRGQRAIEHLRRLLAAVGHLRQAVLVRQATALAAEAPGIRGAFDADALPSPVLAQLDELRQGTRLLDLPGALQELANEGERLRVEQEAIAEVKRLVGSDD